MGKKVIEEFVWQEGDGFHYAETTDGIVKVIETKRHKSRRYSISDDYYPLITHNSGAVLRGPHFRSFESAEEWLLHSFKQLDSPTGGKGDVDNLIFTLEICLRLLPEESDPINYVRLRNMQARVSETVL